MDHTQEVKYIQKIGSLSDLIVSLSYELGAAKGKINFRCQTEGHRYLNDEKICMFCGRKKEEDSKP